MMQPWTLFFRLLGILLLAALLSGAWLFRHEIARRMRPQVERVHEAFGSRAGVPSAEAMARALDKVDSLQGWGADSVVVDADEAASLLAKGLPGSASQHLDSLSVVLGEGSVDVTARLETAQLTPEVLGPLAGALDPWERVALAGPVTTAGAGKAVWRVRALTLRGIRLPEPASHRLVDAGLPGASDGAIPLTLPEGVGGLRVRPSGIALYRKAAS